MRYKGLSTILFILLFLIVCKDSEVVSPVQKGLNLNQNLLLGNPSNATADEVNANNYLLQKPQYTLTYSRDRGTPNWVSWHVSKDWLGNASRQDDFRTDNSLPADWYKVTS